MVHLNLSNTVYRVAAGQGSGVMVALLRVGSLPAVPVAVTVLPMKLYQKWRPGPTRTDPCTTKLPLTTGVCTTAQLCRPMLSVELALKTKAQAR